MNITIKITYWGGTVMDISIPVAIEKEDITKQPAVAVTTPEWPEVASEPANPVAGGLVDCFGDEVTKEDLKPSGNRYSSVSELIARQIEQSCKSLTDSLAHATSGEKRVGEDGEGDGRIGGMGERKEEGGEGEGGEENHDQFKCTDGFYSIPPALYSDFCAAFGAPTVDRELTLARLWVETNLAKRKTRRGMGRFLNAWLCRAQGEKRTPMKARSGSLLDGCTNSVQGW
jgi:hypothetical protein